MRACKTLISDYLSLEDGKERVSLLNFPRLKAVALEARLIHGYRVAGMGQFCALVFLTCSGAISVPLPYTSPNVNLGKLVCERNGCAYFNF